MNVISKEKCVVSGDQPGVGQYLCSNCNIAVDIDKEYQMLPNCPCCEQPLFYPMPDQQQPER